MFQLSNEARTNYFKNIYQYLPKLRSTTMISIFVRADQKLDFS